MGKRRGLNSKELTGLVMLVGIALSITFISVLMNRCDDDTQGGLGPKVEMISDPDDFDANARQSGRDRAGSSSSNHSGRNSSGRSGNSSSHRNSSGKKSKESNRQAAPSSRNRMRDTVPTSY